MIDQEQFPQLHKELQNLIGTRREWLKEALKAELVCDLLPDEIKKLHIFRVDYNFNTLSLSILNKNGTIPTLQRLGVHGLKTKARTTIKDAYFADGVGKLPDGTQLSIHVCDLGKPEGCTLVPKRRRKIEYELVCDKTGEAL